MFLLERHFQIEFRAPLGLRKLMSKSGMRFLTLGRVLGNVLCFKIVMLKQQFEYHNSHSESAHLSRYLEKGRLFWHYGYHCCVLVHAITLYRMQLCCISYSYIVLLAVICSCIVCSYGEVTLHCI